MMETNSPSLIERFISFKINTRPAALCVPFGYMLQFYHQENLDNANKLCTIFFVDLFKCVPILYALKNRGLKILATMRMSAFDTLTVRFYVKKNKFIRFVNCWQD